MERNGTINPFSIETLDTELAFEDRAPGRLGIHLVRNMMGKYHYYWRAEGNR